MANSLTQKTNELSQLGLPPMELAEGNKNDRKISYKCISPIIHKIMVILIIAMCALGIYILILTLLQSDDNNNMQNTEIILVTGSNKAQNISVVQDDVQIVFHLENRTINNLSELRRSKRGSMLNEQSNQNNDVNMVHLTDNTIQKVKKIIEQKLLCKENDVNENCKSLVNKLEALIEKEKENNNNISLKTEVTKNNNNKNEMKDISDIFKRETYSEINDVNDQFREPSQYRFLFDHKKFKPSHPGYYHEEIPPGQNHHEGCVHGIQYVHPAPPYQNHYPPNLHGAYHQYRDESVNIPRMHKPKIHPQDFDIVMSLRQEKYRSDTNKYLNQTLREVECPLGNKPCDNGDACVKTDLWCDGNVDCNDVSDELRCDCRSRVDKARICDFFFDCPFGEDEMGCHGCGEDMFSCGNLDINSQGTCFTKEQRCNNVVDCPNQKDELDCTILGPSLNNKPLFTVSNTEGYLHRNFKGTWYAVCENPYIWAHEACRREVGLVIGPPHIQYVPIDPMVQINYLNTSPGGLLRMSNTCFNSSAVYVICSDIPCGTRVLTKAQHLLENAGVENKLFGRNKRFFSHHPYPYKLYYNNRRKRQDDKNNNANAIRNKRTDIRVVGGQPSQPAAWPWMVALFRDGTFHCGGVIISHHWIMSAAHCVHKFWEHYYEVQVGMLRRLSFSPQESNHQVTHVIITDNYNREDMKNDISILKVKPAIQFNRWVRPICLPSPTTAGHDWMWGPLPKTICTAVGWGATMEHGPDPDHMREVDVPIWEHCKHREDLAGNEICAGLVEGGRDACQGDSGGPLLCRNPINSQQWYLAGIVSHGDGCARKNEPGVYTRVSMFVKWIKYQISSTSLPVIQPKQECPGFRCESGLFKCLPKKRMCDKKIDCLNSEDELNCDFQDTASLPETFVSNTKNFLPEINNIFRNVNEFVSEENVIRTETRTENPFFNTATKSILSSASTSKNINVINKSSTNNNQDRNIILEDKGSSTTKITTLKIIDFSLEDALKHASTIETAFPDTSNEEVTDSIEFTTSTLAKTNTDTFDIQTINIIKHEKDLESMSKVKHDKSIVEKNLEFSTTTQVIFDASNTHGTTEDTSTQSTMITDLITSTFEPENHNLFVKKIIENTSHKAILENNSNNVSHKLLINSVTANDTNPQESDNNKDNNTLQLSSDDTSVVKEIPKIDINKIEDIVMLDLQPANIRKKHTIPDKFQCMRIFQSVSYDNRCDGKADCEDGSDEFGCTCIDYLTTFDKSLICDGNLDCSEGEDENDCFGCDEDQFLCKQSQMCLSVNHVCDGVIHCPRGEDELDCYTLSNGKEIEFDFDGRPKINLEGYLTKKQDNDWKIFCEDNLTILQQEQAAMHICRYLGFSAANKYFVKYINIKEDVTVETPIEDGKKRRSIDTKQPVKFTYRGINDNQHQVINEPEVVKASCVPNITKVCMSLYVFCDSALFTDFNNGKEIVVGRESTTASDHMWPWIAKIFIDGDYKCTGVLLDVSWVVVSHSCLADFFFSQHQLIVILGSHKTLSSTNGAYEQIFRVDFKKDLYRHQAILLHLNGFVNYTSMVKPMILTSPNFQDYENETCLAVGQDNNNQSITLFLKETNENCDSRRRCFIRQSNTSLCERGQISQRGWSGIITCLSRNGWFPVASFSDSRGECGIGHRIIGSDIGDLKFEMKHNRGNIFLNTSENDMFKNCGGVRCSRGKCVQLRQLNDGIKDCEDGVDESDLARDKKNKICAEDPFDIGCECPVDQMKCRNGRCVSKEMFGNSQDDCTDGSDEPGQTTCSKYLSRVMPSRICDGILHCHDRSDEDPSYCKCFAKRVFKCKKSSFLDDYCVASDMVCDGVKDCPNGEDERTCIGLSAPQGTPHGMGKVIIRSHGVWYTKCYPTQHHTKLQLEAICRELGFISGHAKQLPAPLSTTSHPHNSVMVDKFNEVILNNKTMVKLRNTHLPIAKAIVLENLENCYPVYIECL